MGVDNRISTLGLDESCPGLEKDLKRDLDEQYTICKLHILQRG